MLSLRLGAASLAIAATAFTAVYSQPNDDYCATIPPPRGLVARCQSLTLTVPSSQEDLESALTNWMRTCVSSSRAAGLVAKANESVVRMWGLMEDLPRTRSITILPNYEPLSFSRDSKHCYGVDSVSFVIKGAQSVVIDEDFEVTSMPPPQTTGFIDDPTDAQIKEAAKAAIVALQDSEIRNNSGLARFRGVLAGMAEYGKAYDDTWYAVAPTPPFGAACFNDYRNKCLPSDEALKNCTRRLRVQLVTHYVDRKDQPERLRDAMEILNSELFRSFQFFRQMHAAETAAMYCPVLYEVMMPKVSDLAKRGLDHSPPKALYSNY